MTKNYIGRYLGVPIYETDELPSGAAAFNSPPRAAIVNAPHLGDEEWFRREWAEYDRRYVEFKDAYEAYRGASVGYGDARAWSDWAKSVVAHESALMVPIRHSMPILRLQDQ